MKPRAPRYPLEGVVSWNIGTVCNYRCSYCTQRSLPRRDQWARDIDRFLDAFARLPGDWEVKLSGGEPFLHPRFLELVRGLAGQGRRVSVVTNGSASRERLAAFSEATASRPGLVSLSLHLEYVDPLEFREKARWLAELHPGPVSVSCVATRANLPRLPRLVELYAEAGLRLKVQPEKQDREVIAYSPAERALLRRLGGHNGTGLLAPSFRGLPCWAGARYFVLDHRGAAWRCYPARRYKRDFLGDFLSPSFRVWSEARPCTYDYCNCTVPQQRGMVDASLAREAPEAPCDSPAT